jgi:cytochrome P450
MPSIHIDPVYFDAPTSFRPERFIDTASGQFQKCDKVIPFSVGKRSCLGESLGRATIFLYLASFLQKCKFCVPNGERCSQTIEASICGFRDPLPFNCCVIARN